MTLLETLEEAASIADAHAHDEHIEAQEWGDPEDRSPRFSAVATRLRDHARSLREEMERAQRNCMPGGYEWATWAGVVSVLERINGSGEAAKTSPAPTPEQREAKPKP